MIKLLLVDDHELVRTGVRRLLEEAGDIEVLAEATSGEEAMVAVRQYEPDVVLMDVNMPGIGGLEATRKIRQSKPSLPIIVLTMHTDDPFPSSLLKAGANGYLHKGCKPEEMITAVREVYRGRSYISNTVAQGMAFAKLERGEDSPFNALSQREMQVLLMMINGHRTQDIAQQLCLSPKTISTYRHRLYEKLAVSNDAELTKLAICYGLIEGMQVLSPSES